MTAHNITSAPPVSLHVIAVLRRLRMAQRVSAQKLADRVSALGYPVGRSTIANLEANRLSAVTLDYAALAAEALGTSLAAILAGDEDCPQCRGVGPAGFTCNTCGGVS